jgi:processing peptidase subunit alpha
MFPFQILRLKAELAKSSSNPEKILLEALHSTGYSGALANPLIASEYAISKLNADVLEQFIIVRFISRICLVFFMSWYPC